MSAMPHARQMEQVLESLAVGKTDVAPQKLELQPQWRLVSRDGSTSSVSRPPADAENPDCPDCLAGCHDENLQRCQCSGEGDKPTISLDRLTDAKNSETSGVPTGGIAINAAMPHAKPQLFERASKQSRPASFLDSLSLVRETFLADGPTTNGDPAQSGSDAVTTAHPTTLASASQAQGDELQKVIDRWPQLPRGTRRTILELAGALSEAGSA